MGLETARSSTPAYFRDKLYAAFQIIISKDNDELITFINGVRSETKERPYDEVAFPRGVNNLSKYSHPKDIYSKPLKCGYSPSTEISPFQAILLTVCACLHVCMHACAHVCKFVLTVFCNGLCAPVWRNSI